MDARVTIRRTTYRGSSGFTVNWRRDQRGWPQSVFVERQAQATLIKIAIKTATNWAAVSNEINRILLDGEGSVSDGGGNDILR